MLSEEEKRQRALKISQLYYVPTEHPSGLRYVTPDTFSWSKLIGLAIRLPLPFAALSLGLGLFSSFSSVNVTDTTNVTDAAAAGLIFLVALLVILGWLYFVIKFCAERLNATVVNTTLMFWLTWLCLLPSLWLLHSAIVSGVRSDVSAIYIEAAKYTLDAVILSLVTVVLLAVVLERNAASNATKVGLALLITSVPYVVWLITTLAK